WMKSLQFYGRRAPAQAARSCRAESDTAVRRGAVSPSVPAELSVGPTD
ncbi:MAG: hypothetical protein AVDCRST_MAG68-2166, partial [uncultured Gemmatimonadetes bacterium]